MNRANRNVLRLLTLGALVLGAGTAWAADDDCQQLPQQAADLLGMLEDAEILPAASNWVTGVQNQLGMKTCNYWETPAWHIDDLDLEGRFAVYKPSGSESWLFAAMFGSVSLESIGLDTPLGDAALTPAVMIYAQAELEEVGVSAWPHELGTKLGALTGSGSLIVNEKLNVFARLAGGDDGGDLADFLREINLDLESVTVAVRKTSEEVSAEIMHWDAWVSPFGIEGTSFSGTTISLAKEGDERTVQAWGIFTLQGEDYFLWGSQTKSPVPRRGFGLAAAEISLEAVKDLVEAISSESFGDIPLPLDAVLIKSSYSAPEPGELPDAFIFFYADPYVEVAHIGSSDSAIVRAEGDATLLGWEAASLRIDFQPEQNQFHASGQMKEGELPFPMPAANFEIEADPPAMTFSGGYVIEGVQLAASSVSVSETKMNMTVDMGCIPPFLKATLDNVSWELGAIPEPRISESSCANIVADALGAAAAAFGEALDAIGCLLGAENEGCGTTANQAVRLYQTASEYQLIQSMLTSMSEMGVEEAPLLEGAGPFVPIVKISDLSDRLEDINCKARGRISRILDILAEIPDSDDFIAYPRAALSGYNTYEAEALSADLCAQLCRGWEDFDCLSFDYKIESKKRTIETDEFERHPGKALRGHNTERRSEPSARACERLCVEWQDFKCLSFDFRREAEKVMVETDEFDHYPGKALAGHNTERLSAVASARACERLCVEWKDFVCLSFDFDKRSAIPLLGSIGSYKCDLSDTRVSAVELSENDDYDHYSRVQRTRELPRVHRCDLSDTRASDVGGLSESEDYDHYARVQRTEELLPAVHRCDLSDTRASDVGGLSESEDYDHYARGPKHFSRFEGSYIAGHNKETLKNASVDECAAACVARIEFDCLSFDYDKATGECDLSESSYVTAGGLDGGGSHDRYDHYQRNGASLDVEKELNFYEPFREQRAEIEEIKASCSGFNAVSGACQNLRNCMAERQ